MIHKTLKKSDESKLGSVNYPIRIIYANKIGNHCKCCISSDRATYKKKRRRRKNDGQ